MSGLVGLALLDPLLLLLPSSRGTGAVLSRRRRRRVLVFCITRSVMSTCDECQWPVFKRPVTLSNDATQSPHRPEVGFITKFGSRIENQFMKFLFVEFLQQTRPPAIGPTLQAVFTFGIILRHPPKDGRAMRSMRTSNLSDWHAVTNDFYRTKSNLIVGIEFLGHGEELMLLSC